MTNPTTAPIIINNKEITASKPATNTAITIIPPTQTNVSTISMTKSLNEIDDKNDNNKTIQTLCGMSSKLRISNLQLLLHKYTSDNKLLSDKNAAQHKAAEWIMHIPEEEDFSNSSNSDDNIIICPHDKNVMQRYAIAVLYFSLGGEQWHNSYNFLSRNINECEWGSISNSNGSINNSDNVVKCNALGEITEIIIGKFCVPYSIGCKNKFLLFCINILFFIKIITDKNMYICKR